jgi:hypothetical protein
MEIWFPILWVGIGYMLICRRAKKAEAERIARYGPDRSRTKP